MLKLDSTMCFKKRHPFYFCENLAKCYPISIIFGSSIPEEICNKSVHVCPPHLFSVLIQYLVKVMIPLPVFTLFKNVALLLCATSLPYAIRILIIFSRQISEEFCNVAFMSLCPPNLACMLQLYATL